MSTIHGFRIVHISDVLDSQTLSTNSVFEVEGLSGKLKGQPIAAHLLFNVSANGAVGTTTFAWRHRWSGESDDTSGPNLETATVSGGSTGILRMLIPEASSSASTDPACWIPILGDAGAIIRATNSNWGTGITFNVLGSFIVV